MKTKFILIVFISVLLINDNLFAAVIKVLEAEDGRPIYGVSISIGTNKKYFYTDKHGKLEVDISSPQRINLKKTGYKSILDTLYITSDECVYYMEKDAFLMDQIVVTATRTDKTLKESPVITQVIDKESIVEQGYSDVKELLSAEVPSLEFSDTGPMGIQINSGGLNAKNILFLIDGERLAGEKSDNIDYSRLNISNIERIEIVRGAGSALYGSQAMGSVINIITSEPKEGFSASIGGKYTQRNGLDFEKYDESDRLYNYKKGLDKLNLNGQGTLGYKKGGFSSLLDFTYQTDDGYQLYDREGERRNYKSKDCIAEFPVSTTPTTVSGNESINIGEKLSYETGDLKLSANIRWFNLNKYDWVKDNQHEQNIDYSYGLKVNYKNLLVSMNADNYDRYSKSEINTDNRSLIYTNDIYNPKIQYTFDRLKNNLFNFGAELLFDRLYSDRFTYNVYESKKQWLASIFVQDDWDVTDKINIVLGARLDEHKEYGLNAAPKASIKYDLTPFTLRFNYSNGYRCPTLKELYMFWDHQGMFTIVGSKDLRPEKNNYFSLSTEYVSSIIYCNVLAYANLFTNKIDGIWTNDETVYLYSNIGKTELYGVDLNTKIKIVKDLFFHGNVNYLIKQHNSAVAANIISPLCLSGRLEYKKNLSFADLVVNLSSTYRSGKDYSVLDDNDEEYFVHIDDYVITNSSVSCVFQNKYRITLGINNIFDYTAPIVSFNSTNTPGRRMFCAFNVDF